MNHLKKFNESLRWYRTGKSIFSSKFDIDVEDMEDYLIELTDEYRVLINGDVKKYVGSSRNHDEQGHWKSHGELVNLKDHFYIIISPKMDIEGFYASPWGKYNIFDIKNKMDNFISKMKRFGVEFINYEENSGDDLEYESIVYNFKGRLKEKTNESLQIIDQDKFFSKYDINMEDMEDYLTELTDEYKVMVYDEESRGVTGHLSRAKPIDYSAFYVIIMSRSDRNPISNFFSPHSIMIRMEQFIKRMKFLGVEFLGLEVKDGTYLPHGEMPIIQNRLQTKILEYKFRGKFKYKNGRRISEGFVDNTWGELGINIEDIEDYLTELSDVYDVGINRMHPRIKRFGITIITKNGNDLTNTDRRSIMDSMNQFTKRAGLKDQMGKSTGKYNENPTFYSNGIKYTFEIE